jgi:hypothetical protein
MHTTSGPGVLLLLLLLPRGCFAAQVQHTQATITICVFSKQKHSIKSYVTPTIGTLSESENLLDYFLQNTG